MRRGTCSLSMACMMSVPGLVSTTTSAIAPACCACHALVAKEQVPRSATATVPFTPESALYASQPVGLASSWNV